MRQGPKPLFYHLTMANAYLKDDANREVALADMIQGIQRYQTHSYKPQPQERHIVWSSHTVTLFKIGAAKIDANKPACVLIPSLINSSEIFDLMHDASFAQWMSRQGIDVYILDWGNLCADNTNPDIEALILRRVIPALDFLKSKTHQKIDLLGYCMGANFASAISVCRPDLVNSLALISPPWDYEAGQKFLHARVSFWASSAFSILEEKNVLPAQWLQMVFVSLDPDLSRRKFTKFANMDEGSNDQRRFIAVEDWINSGFDLPAKIAKTCIQNWFLNNDLANGHWRVGEYVIKPGAIQCPVLIIASKKDKLVEYESSYAFFECLNDTKLIEPNCGHIGMMAGRNSDAEVWQPICEWINIQNADA